MDEIEVPGFCTGILQQLQIFWSCGTLCDVKVCARDGDILTHRLVLMAASPHLAGLLARTDTSTANDGINDVANKSSPVDVLNLDTVSIDILTAVVRLIYTGKLCVNGDNVEGVKAFCETLDLKSAVEVCERYMKREETGQSAAETCNYEGIKMKVKLRENDQIEFVVDDEEPVRKKRKSLVGKKEKGVVGETKTTRVRKATNPKRKSDIKPKLGSKTKLKDSVKQKVKIKQEVIDDEKLADGHDVSGNDGEDLKRDIDDLLEMDKNLSDSDDEIHDGNFDSDTDDLDLDLDYDPGNGIGKKSKDPKLKTTGKKRGPKPKIKDESIPPKPKLKPGRKPRDPSIPRPKKKRRKKQFPCSQGCSRVLSSYKRKVFHEFSKHGIPFDETRYAMVPCKEEGCNYIAADRRSLDAHMKSRHGVARPHICEFCGKGFKLATILATHINIHTDGKKWKCEQCGEGFNQQSGLLVHTRRHHMGEASWGELCHLCSEKFMMKQELAWHLFKVHKQAIPDHYKVYVCDICDFCTMKRASLISHQERHEGIKKHICPVCSKACSTKSELRRHVGFHGEKKFKCTFEGCSFACTDAIGLDKHIMLMHTHKDYKPYACPVCPYRTGVRGNVDKHIRTVHDLVVITKHTVELKMKYPQFSSGDVITKEGHLVATSQERKALQQAPPTDKDGNMIMALDKSIQTSLGEISTSDKGYQKYKKIKKGRFSALPDTVNITPTSQTDIPIGGLMHTVSNNTSTRDFASLSNYVYIHGDSVVASNITTLGSSGEAQDMRLPVGVAVSTCEPEQASLYGLGNGDLFLPSKLEYQSQ